MLHFLDTPAAADVGAVLEQNLQCGATNFRVMAMLSNAHTDTFGHPVPTPVSLNPKPGKAILVTGHDMHDLHLLLEQTQGLGINVYTHGEVGRADGGKGGPAPGWDSGRVARVTGGCSKRWIVVGTCPWPCVVRAPLPSPPCRPSPPPRQMLPAHGYPGLKKYPHLAGHFGGAWYRQKVDFANFPGAIAVTTNCVLDPLTAYKSNIWTINEVRSRGGGEGGVRSGRVRGTLSLGHVHAVLRPARVARLNPYPSPHPFPCHPRPRPAWPACPTLRPTALGTRTSAPSSPAPRPCPASRPRRCPTGRTRRTSR